MFYIVYKTTNLVNHKFYIGKHTQPIDPYHFDGYYGSGSQIINAVKKFYHSAINLGIVTIAAFGQVRFFFALRVHRLLCKNIN
jgi:hypothetical protein